MTCSLSPIHFSICRSNVSGVWCSSSSLLLVISFRRFHCCWLLLHSSQSSSSSCIISSVLLFDLFLFGILSLSSPSSRSSSICLSNVSGTWVSSLLFCLLGDLCLFRPCWLLGRLFIVGSWVSSLSFFIDFPVFSLF